MTIEETTPVALPDLIDARGKRVLIDDARMDGDELFVRPTFMGGGYLSEKQFPILGWSAANDRTRGMFGDWSPSDAPSGHDEECGCSNPYCQV